MTSECACCRAAIPEGQGIECFGCFRIVCLDCINYDTPDHHDQNCDCCLGVYAEKVKVRRLASCKEGIAALINALDLLPPAGLDTKPEFERLASEETPWWAAQVLGEIRAKVAAPYLAAALKNGHPATRQFAARSLGEVGDSSFVNALIEALGDRENMVRIESMMALGKLGGQEAESQLLGILQDHADQGRWAAAWGLVDMCSHAAAPYFLEELEDPQSKLKGLAVDGLAAVNETRTVPVLLELLKQDKMAFLDKAQVIAALGCLADESALPVLTSFLDASIPEVAQAAQNSIEQINERTPPSGR